MAAVCLYLQIHQPFRLRKYTVFDAEPSYFDTTANAQILKTIAQRCYLPLTKHLLELISLHRGGFKVALSVTGTAMEQFEQHAPEVVHALHTLATTGCVEFLGETYYHSLASLYSKTEFYEQVDLHKQMIKRLFGHTPTVFRNTELIYSSDIAAMAKEMGFAGILAEGWEEILKNRSAAFLYQAGKTDLGLLLRNYRLSDTIAFRFSNRSAPEYPVTAEKFATLVDQIGGQLCNLFMDSETFGEHQRAETGIWEFLQQMPGQLRQHNAEFRLPREIIQQSAGAGELDVPLPMSWADANRDLGAWTGNTMQKNALEELYKLEPLLRKRNNPKLLSDWRKLTTSDHAYYMSTKGLGGDPMRADGAVHAYFRPYDSPYDAYINFMNVLENLRARAT